VMVWFLFFICDEVLSFRHFFLLKIMLKINL
jgi:hypothetical protein